MVNINQTAALPKSAGTLSRPQSQQQNGKQLTYRGITYLAVEADSAAQPAEPMQLQFRGQPYFTTDCSGTSTYQGTLQFLGCRYKR